MRKITFSLALIVALVLVTAAPVLTSRTQAQDDTTEMAVGLLPILDVLPFYVAQEQGYFDDAGLNVELIPVSSALERDQLLVAEEIDGMLNDLISTGLFNQDEPRIQVVAQARRAYPDAPQFRILAAPDSGLETPEDLVGVAIGISENSVIHYITQRILEAEGIDPAELQYIPEPNIPVRYQLLLEGELQAATLPDPLAQAAILDGAILIADDTGLIEEEFTQSVLTFRTEFIDDNPDAVQAFLDVWMRAAEDINADPEAYRELWIEQTNVPDAVRDSYELPPFPTYSITQELAWDDTMDWLMNQEIIDQRPTYETSVNPAFLNEIAPEEITTQAVGDAVNGEVVYQETGCAGCHSVEAGVDGAGPSLAGIATRALTTVEGQSAEAYIREAIVHPSAYVVEGYGDIMPAYDTLSESDLNDLIAYLMTLE